MRERLRHVADLPRYRGKVVIDDDGLLWWFLRERRLHVADATEKLVRCLRWRQEFRVDKLGPELFTRELRSRKCYLHDHNDVAGRPVLVVKARRHNVLERRLEESCRLCAWFMERALDRLATSEPPAPTAAAATAQSRSLLPAEQALGIFDLRGFSPVAADPEFAGFLVEALYNYYPGRVGRVLFVGAPDLFRAFWGTVRPLLGRYVALADFVTPAEVRQHYFEPGFAPPEFQ